LPPVFLSLRINWRNNFFNKDQIATICSKKDLTFKFFFRNFVKSLLRRQSFESELSRHLSQRLASHFLLCQQVVFENCSGNLFLKNSSFTQVVSWTIAHNVLQLGAGGSLENKLSFYDKTCFKDQIYSFLRHKTSAERTKCPAAKKHGKTPLAAKLCCYHQLRCRPLTLAFRQRPQPECGQPVR